MSFLLQIRFLGYDFVGFRKKSSMYLPGTPPGYLLILLVSLQKSNFRNENHFVTCPEYFQHFIRTKGMSKGSVEK